MDERSTSTSRSSSYSSSHSGPYVPPDSSTSQSGGAEESKTNGVARKNGAEHNGKSKGESPSPSFPGRSGSSHAASKRAARRITAANPNAPLNKFRRWLDTTSPTETLRAAGYASLGVNGTGKLASTLASTAGPAAEIGAGASFGAFSELAAAGQYFDAYNKATAYRDFVKSTRSARKDLAAAVEKITVAQAELKALPNSNDAHTQNVRKRLERTIAKEKANVDAARKKLADNRAVLSAKQLRVVRDCGLQLANATSNFTTGTGKLMLAAGAPLEGLNLAASFGVNGAVTAVIGAIDVYDGLSEWRAAKALKSNRRQKLLQAIGLADALPLDSQEGHDNTYANMARCLRTAHFRAMRQLHRNVRVGRMRQVRGAFNLVGGSLMAASAAFPPLLLAGLVVQGTTSMVWNGGVISHAVLKRWRAKCTARERQRTAENFIRRNGWDAARRELASGHTNHPHHAAKPSLDRMHANEYLTIKVLADDLARAALNPDDAKARERRDNAVTMLTALGVKKLDLDAVADAANDPVGDAANNPVADHAAPLRTLRAEFEKLVAASFSVMLFSPDSIGHEVRSTHYLAELALGTHLVAAVSTQGRSDHVRTAGAIEQHAQALGVDLTNQDDAHRGRLTHKQAKDLLGRLQGQHNLDREDLRAAYVFMDETCKPEKRATLKADSAMRVLTELLAFCDRDDEIGAVAQYGEKMRALVKNGTVLIDVAESSESSDAIVGIYDRPDLQSAVSQIQTLPTVRGLVKKHAGTLKNFLAIAGGRWGEVPWQGPMVAHQIWQGLEAAGVTAEDLHEAREMLDRVADRHEGRVREAEQRLAQVIDLLMGFHAKLGLDGQTKVQKRMQTLSSISKVLQVLKDAGMPISAFKKEGGPSRDRVEHAMLWRTARAQLELSGYGSNELAALFKAFDENYPTSDLERHPIQHDAVRDKRKVLGALRWLATEPREPTQDNPSTFARATPVLPTKRHQDRHESRKRKIEDGALVMNAIGSRVGDVAVLRARLEYAQQLKTEADRVGGAPCEPEPDLELALTRVELERTLKPKLALRLGGRTSPDAMRRELRATMQRGLGELAELESGVLGDASAPNVFSYMQSMVSDKFDQRVVDQKVSSSRSAVIGSIVGIAPPPDNGPDTLTLRAIAEDLVSVQEAFNEVEYGGMRKYLQAHGDATTQSRREKFEARSHVLALYLAFEKNIDAPRLAQLAEYLRVQVQNFRNQTPLPIRTLEHALKVLVAASKSADFRMEEESLVESSEGETSATSSATGHGANGVKTTNDTRVTSHQVLSEKRSSSDNGRDPHSKTVRKPGFDARERNFEDSSTGSEVLLVNNGKKP